RREDLHERLGERRVAGLLERERGVDLVHAEPALLLGEHHAEEARLGERRVRSLGRSPLPHGADDLRRALAREDLAHGVAKHELIFGEAETHLVTSWVDRGLARR